MTHISEYPGKLNLDNCAREPIHIIGKTQAHGVLLSVDPENFKIIQVGENATQFFGKTFDSLLEKDLTSLLGEEQMTGFVELLNSEEISVPREVFINNTKFLMLAHNSGPNLILNFEPLQEVDSSYHFQRQLTRVLNKFKAAKSVDQLCNAATILTKEMFGYDRVMIYRFDEEWNGEVIAEIKEEDMGSWLGLHYPATDIPAQSRELFLKHQVRVITDVHYTPVPITPEISPLNEEPLDISRSGLRAVSPIHIEYLKNMKVGASLSAAIIIKGKLWGLIACHHKTAKYLDFYQRESCRFLVQMFSTELTLQENTALITQAKLSESIRRQLVVQMQEENDVVKALSEGNVKFTQIISCGGGAIFMKDQWKPVGNTPETEQLESLLNFIKKQPKNLFSTRNLSALLPEADAYKEVASGVLCIKIAEYKYIFWFKPEQVQEVNWGGNPKDKAFYNEKEDRLSPRKSFEKWSEKLTGISEAWQENDRDVARALRESISYILLAQQQKEIEALNTQLMEANEELKLFSYGLSHDLRAPVRGMEGILTILDEDHRKELSEEGRELLQMSRDLNEKMNDLIDNILEYSRLNHSDGLEVETVNTSELIGEVLKFVNVQGSYPKTTVKIQAQLPDLKGDRSMLFQLWSNLINNALKYSSEEENPFVEVGAEQLKGRKVFYVKDNGIGVPKKMKKKIFETFQRGVGSRFKGTGIGLAIVKRIIEKHQGDVWLESEEGKGSIFYFYIEI
ncbi:ATP-binding protein [Salinimicrobium sediminilitoris]|uniref:ATP-binding protein n=1 Tax=Salinimicrobium sediminilitoris TaxID=2876715 RepID=UPI001E3A8C76|nr:ATP-binding protein [Salinimicrobium sediminilitoris]MCC8358982.1 GAF domain-containing protein [Salinimicrobium sediminilitoris]